MKIAIFIDGKNFYKGYEKHARGRRINFPRLASWLVERAGGALLVGCHYYTGVESGPSALEDGAARLGGFLRMLEMQRGYFVHSLPRKLETTRCPSCGAEHSYTAEKEVDTTMVADMLQQAAVGAFDALVLVSGDADLAPAVEGVRSFGKVVFVASWGEHGMAPRVRRAAFDHIDLLSGLPEFDEGVPPPRPAEEPGDDEFDRLLLQQLRLAEDQFRGGYVGLSYFLRRWRAEGFTTAEAERQRALERLVQAGKLELYVADDGSRALRSAPQ